MCVYVCVLQDGSLVVPAYLDAEHGMVRHLNSHMGMSPKGDHHMHHGLAHSLQQEEDERYHDERDGEEREANLRGGNSHATQVCYLRDTTMFLAVVVVHCTSHGSMPAWRGFILNILPLLHLLMLALRSIATRQS